MFVGLWRDVLGETRRLQRISCLSEAILGAEAP